MRIPSVIRNIIALSLLSLIESIHLLVPIILVTNFLFPLKYDPAIWNKYFTYLQSGIQPNHNFFFYHCWLPIVCAMQVFLIWFCRNSLNDPKLFSRLRGYLLNETIFLLLLLFCAFKIIVGQGPGWAWVLLYCVLALSWAVRIFWPEASKGMAWLNLRLVPVVVSPWSNVLMGVVIVLLIYPLDLESVLARIFIQERFHHFTGVIMAPGWAYLTGCTLNVDVLCLYGIGMTIMVTKLSQVLGGFSYENVLLVFIYLTCIYFMAAYLLLRFWQGSFLLAAAGLFLMIKFQMFHLGVAPIYWEFFSATVLRYFFDMFFLGFILYHIRQKTWGLKAASLCVGISLAYVPETGAYQYMALLVYLGILWVEQRKIHLVIYALCPLFLAFGILAVLQGPTLFSKAFWQGAVDQGSLFLNGHGALPIYTNLSQGHFFAFFLGILIPIVYVFTLIFAGANYYLDRSRRENIFVVVLSIYGLGLYHYFICRSALSSYHAVDIPFVFILCFWAREIMRPMQDGLRRAITIGLCVLSLGALLTNYFFTYYPNALNLSRYDWSKEKAFYRQQFHFEEDAQLIARLTAPDEKVPVISSLDIKILMEAKRKPFFYYSPLLFPNYIDSNAFMGTRLLTKASLEFTLNQLNTAKPPYIYVQAILFKGRLAPEVYQQHHGLRILMEYLHANYEEAAQGKYLLALKRKKL